MAKFYGHGGVWHPVKLKLMAEFNNGVYETDDMDIIETLRGLGYQEEVIDSGDSKSRTATRKRI